MPVIMSLDHGCKLGPPCANPKQGKPLDMASACMQSQPFEDSLFVIEYFLMTFVKTASLLLSEKNETHFDKFTVKL